MPAQPLTFPRAHRLSGELRFAAVYDAKVRVTRGPLLFFGLPNQAGHARLGLSVSRKVGTAPRRARIKRLLREAYRHERHALPGSYDLVVVVRPHEPLPLNEYRELLKSATAKIDQHWNRQT